jgi:hypothetical protein
MTLPRAEALAAELVGRSVRTYLWREARVERVEHGVAAVAGARGEQGARVALADIQTGLDQLAAAGEVQVTIAALGPWATYVAAMLVAVEGAAYDDAPARVVLDPAVRGGLGRASGEGGESYCDA